MRKIMFFIAMFSMFSACDAYTDKCKKEHSWQVVVRNTTNTDALIVFYGDKTGKLHAVAAKASGTTQFLSGASCPQDDFKDGPSYLFLGYIDSAAVVFADGKRISFAWSNVSDSIADRYSPIAHWGYTYDGETQIYTLDDELYCLAK